MPRFDSEYTSKYYDEYAEKESKRLKEGARAKIQLAIYRHHLNRLVKAGDRILDAGCGPGTFTKILLEMGTHVSCLDISPIQLDACREYAPGAEAYHEGSITDLSCFQDHQFDITLALGGPLSYCFDKCDDALREMIRVTKPGGRLMLSVMNLYGSLRQFLPSVLTQDAKLNQKIVDSGDLERESNRGHECHMFRYDEFKSLLESHALKDIEIHAEGWLTSSPDSPIPDEGTPDWNFLIQAELEASRESPAAGTRMIASASIAGVA